MHPLVFKMLFQYNKKAEEKAMILSCQNISKQFGETAILSDCSFHIEDHEKAAIVGINGAGKTTLLRIIVGELTPDDGIVTLSKGKTLGYLSQSPRLRAKIPSMTNCFPSNRI